MTDEQIMQGLKWCYQVEGSCGDCPYRPNDIKKARCHDRLGNDVIDLICRQQTEIDRLEVLFNDQQEIIADLEWTVENEGFKHLGKMYSELRAETIKEFVRKLKIYVLNPNKDFYVMLDDIDNLVKEMVGDSNA